MIDVDIFQAIEQRHSVRSYIDKKIEKDTELHLRKIIDDVNRESGLHIQLCLNEPLAFGGGVLHYGKFENCNNYIVMAGKEGVDEKCGYYGEKVVLEAQIAGLNTCWVALTYNKSKVKCDLDRDEKILYVIALGYGTTGGVQHKSKDITKLCECDGDMPEWFRNGMKAAALAPTALNQQKFLFKLRGNTVYAKALAGFYTKVDLGIVKYHFEIGAGKGNFVWG